MVSTLPEMSLTEDQIVIESSTFQLDNDNNSVILSHNIRLRNCCLNITRNLLKADSNKKSSQNWWVFPIVLFCYRTNDLSFKSLEVCCKWYACILFC